MPEQTSAEDSVNYTIFRDCLSELIVSRLSPSKSKRKIKGRKNEIKPVATDVDRTTDAADLADFIDYIGHEIFGQLDNGLTALSYEAVQNDKQMAERYSTPLDSEVYDGIYESLPPSVMDSFESYALLPESMALSRMLEPVFNSYIDAVTIPPPEHDYETKPTECEICDREHLPLTYHHLIPRQMHAKAIKRGWAKEWELQKVSWLCRACHSFVHRIASNEELAKELNDIDKLLAREDVQSWAAWIGRIRWKKR